MKFNSFTSKTIFFIALNFLAVNMIYLGIGGVVDFFREAVKKLLGLSAGGDFSDKLGPLVGVIEN